MIPRDEEGRRSLDSAAPVNPTHANSREVRSRTGKRTPDAAGSVLQSPLKLKFECPVCGGELDCDFKLGSFGDAEWFYNCFSCASRLSRAEYNDELRACEVAPWKLKAGSFEGLRQLGPGANADRDPAPLPTAGNIDGWRSVIETAAGAQAWRYLTRKRGLRPETIRFYRLGWDRDRRVITLPVYDRAGDLVNLRVRKLGPGEPFKGLAGRGAQLYPMSAVTATGPLAVCEGEFDALVLNQSGFRAVTSTAGAGHWNPEWTPLLRGHAVAVVYDVDAEDRAKQRAAEFRAAGLTAFAVRLSRGGFAGKADISDVLVGAGKSTAWFRHLIRRERRAAA